MVGAEPIVHTADQHRYIGPLAAAVGVKLVQHDEVEPVRVCDNGAVEWGLARHQQLKHHEIGEQDVDLCVADAFALFRAFLAGIAREGRPQPIGQSRLIDVLFEFLELAVCQRVHRVDHDRACAGRFPGDACTNGRVNDGHEKAEGLARAGTRRNDEALASRGLCHSLGLVAVERDRLTVHTKHIRRLWME
jgi:hypothetical protein